MRGALYLGASSGWVHRPVVVNVDPMNPVSAVHSQAACYLKSLGGRMRSVSMVRLLSENLIIIFL